MNLLPQSTQSGKPQTNNKARVKRGMWGYLRWRRCFEFKKELISFSPSSPYLLSYTKNKELTYSNAEYAGGKYLALPS
jgi:hypothetical protein